MKKIHLTPYADQYTYFSARRVARECLYYIMERQEAIDASSIKLVNELCSTSILALGLMHGDEAERWLRAPEAYELTPDAYIMSFQETTNRIAQIHQVEVVTMEEHTASDDIVQFLINTKLSDTKSYPVNSDILCHLAKDMKVKSWEDIRQALMPHMKSKKLFIHFIARVNISPTKFQVVSMGYDKNQFIVGDPFDLIKMMEKPAKDLMKLERRSGLYSEQVRMSAVDLFTEDSR